MGRPICGGEGGLRMLHLQLHLQATSQCAGYSTCGPATLQAATSVGTLGCCNTCCPLVAAATSGGF